MLLGARSRRTDGRPATGRSRRGIRAARRPGDRLRRPGARSCSRPHRRPGRRAHRRASRPARTRLLASRVTMPASRSASRSAALPARPRAGSRLARNSGAVVVRATRRPDRRPSTSRPHRWSPMAAGLPSRGRIAVDDRLVVAMGRRGPWVDIVLRCRLVAGRPPPGPRARVDSSGPDASTGPGSSSTAIAMAGGAAAARPAERACAASRRAQSWNVGQTGKALERQ